MILKVMRRFQNISKNNVFLQKLYRITAEITKAILSLFPDKTYIKLMYREKMGKRLDLKNPKTFNEKLQWLKIYDRNPRHTIMVDKYEVRNYISQKIGSKHLIPLYGVWDRFGDIEFEKLPNKFVLKCTHDSGSVILCRDKANFDFDKAKQKISKSLQNNYYYKSREWPYKNVKPRIIAEKFMELGEDEYLTDYKYFCFDGDPKFLYVGQGLTADHSLKIDFYDIEWKKTPFYRTDYPPLGEIPKPSNFKEMVDVAKRLSAGIPFVRVDLYSIKDTVYFSEFTFSPAGGMIHFEPKCWDHMLGNLIDLSLAYNVKEYKKHNLTENISSHEKE